MEFLTKEKLTKILTGNKHIDEWFLAITTILPKYEINTILRVSAFLAQTAHESANFTVIKENLNYRAASLMTVFRKYFPTIEMAQAYEHKPEKIANRVYANRMGNGPETSGDGFKYCGRGLIQLTGKSNYVAFGKSIGKTADEVIEYMKTSAGALESALWFWKQNSLNNYADASDMKSITKRINGGYNGLEDRLARYNKIIQILEA
jgi:putative chitinase